MKITLNKKTALAAVQSLLKVIPQKAAMPIIENILVTASDTLGIGLLATDLEAALCISFPVDGANTVEEAGVAVLPARLLVDMLKQIEEEKVTISTEGDATAVIDWGRGRSSIPAYPSEDFPATDLSLAEADEFEIPGDELLKGLAATMYACSDDQIRPALNGILFDCSKEGLTLVASDTHRLAVRDIPSVKTGGKRNFILHRRIAAILKGTVTEEDAVSVRFGDERAVFKTGGTVLSTRNIVGKFPNYSSVIPKDGGNILAVEPKSFSAALRRVSVCASRANFLVRIALSGDLAGGSAEIKAQDLGYSTSAFEKVAVDYSGEPMEIGFKSNYLQECIDSIQDESVRLKITDTRRAVLLEAGTPSEGSRTSVVLMPMAVA